MRTIVHLSDLHFGRLDPPVADSLVPYLKAIRYDLLIMSGDFTQRATARQYQDSVAWLEQFPDPKLYVPGNHDVPLWAFWERFFWTFGRYNRHVTKNMEPVWEDDEVVVMGIATPRAFVPVHNGFWKDGRITEKQIRHVVRRMEQEKFSIVVTHHPFVPPPGHRAEGIVLGGKKVLPLLADAGVDALLAGHLHASYHAQIDVGPGRTIFSIQASTATSTRRRHSPAGEEYANAFNLLHCSRDHLEIQVHSHSGGSWGKTSHSIYKRVNGKWASVDAG